MRASFTSLKIQPAGALNLAKTHPYLWSLKTGPF
jgi:hypothetical protein